jgi:hypothetical protein
MQRDTGGGAAAAGTFRHVHLVRVNDPANAVDVFMSREQLWTGLWQTIVAPYSFDATVDACTVDHVGSDRLERSLTRGGVTSTDAVDIAPTDSLNIRAGGSHAGSSLRIAIEEPAPQMLFVRFTYELAGSPDLPPEQAAALRAAYEASDVDRMRQVRRYVARDDVPRDEGFR